MKNFETHELRQLILVTVVIPDVLVPRLVLVQRGLEDLDGALLGNANVHGVVHLVQGPAAGVQNDRLLARAHDAVDLVQHAGVDPLEQLEPRRLVDGGHGRRLVLLLVDASPAPGFL